jgi:hypothetical protein
MSPVRLVAFQTVHTGSQFKATKDAQLSYDPRLSGSISSKGSWIRFGKLPLCGVLPFGRPWFEFSRDWLISGPHVLLKSSLDISMIQQNAPWGLRWRSHVWYVTFGTHLP